MVKKARVSPALGNESSVLGVGGVDEDEIQNDSLSAGSLEISDMGY
jgi:hypothetical protein